MKRIQFKDAVTKRWILQQQHSKAVLAHISAFLKECTNTGGEKAPAGHATGAPDPEWKGQSEK